MAFDRKIFEITLPVSQEILKVRQINAFEVVKLYGKLPKVELENGEPVITAELIGLNSKVCVGAIIQHGSKKIVDKDSSEVQEGEIAFLELPMEDQNYLIEVIIRGVDPQKKSGEQK